MKNVLARLEALEKGAPCKGMLFVTEWPTAKGMRYLLPDGQCLALPDVYVYMRAHGQGILFIDDLATPKREEENTK